MLCSPAGPEGDMGGGSDNTSAGLMDSWGDGQGAPQSAPPQTPPPRQVTPPVRARTNVIADNTDANAGHNAPANDPAQQPPATTQQPVPPAHQLSEADLTRIAATAAGAARAAVQPAHQPQQPATMSDAEFASRYKTPTVDAAFMQQLMDTDPAKGAAVMNGVLKQTYTSALLMANDLFQAELAKMRGEFQPHVESFRSFQASQQKTALENEFYSLHPDLATERDLVNEVIDSFQAKVARKEISFADKTSAFKAVADASKKLLARMSASSDGQQSPPAQPAQRRPAAATSQGRSGSGQPQNLSPMDKVMASWDQ